MPTELQNFLDLFGQNPYLQAAILVIAAIVFATIADRVIGLILRSWAKRTATDLDDRLIQLLHKPVFVSVLLVGFWFAIGRLELSTETLNDFRNLLKSLALLVWVVFLLRACTILLDILSRLEKRFTAIQPRTVSLFDQLSKISIVAGSVYVLFKIWGVDVGALLAAGGIVGIAIGFAAKDTLANLFSGIFILADTPYKVGDFIVLDSGDRGQVTQIGLRSTRLLTRDDLEVTLPNAIIANAKITNESGGRWEKQRLRVRVGVAYGSDIDRVKEVLLSVAQEHPDIDDDPEPRVRFRSFGESGLDLELLGWIHEPVIRGRVMDDLNTEIYKRFAAAGIEIPYPKRDVYLYSQPPSSAS